MMTKMKKMNVLIYQVTRFARDKYYLHISNLKSIFSFEILSIVVASEASDLIN